MVGANGYPSLEIYFSTKGDDKSQVVVQHTKLPNAAAATKMKGYWTRALARLRANLESSDCQSKLQVGAV